ncbi:MAG: hypothetical protein KAG04_01670, partial [Mycoplasmataceae bacterium]|nr:hypothetical protein [Mycoplasmataceae bacterium]
MKKSLSTAILITAGSVAGVGIGYGAFILWKQVGKNKEDSYINQTWIDTAKGAAEDIYGVKLIEASIIENKKDTKVMFLGKVGLDVLARRIKNELNYGPEISGLKDIVIGDANVVGKEANGVYYPLTHEIFINTENIRNKGFDLSKTPTVPEDIANRVALIFDIIFHEYGHYLTDTYLNSLPLTSTKASQWIFDRSGIKSHWDKDFVTNLKRIMYNSD